MFPKSIAVLTGDLIRSTEQPSSAVDAAMYWIASAAISIVNWSTPADPRFTRFRGDGWQFYIEDAQYCLRAALVVAAVLRARDVGLSTRLSIAIGSVENLGSKDLSDASGEAFQVSGRAFDAMPRTGRIAIAGNCIGERDRIIARQMFERTSRWTVPQAEAMALYLHPDNLTLHELSARLGISPQAVNYRLGGGGAVNLRTNLQLWEEVIEHELANASK